MKSRLQLFVLTSLILSLSAPAAGPATRKQQLIVHEWGTFTTVAGASGAPVPWQTYTDSLDLPPFVHKPFVKSITYFLQTACALQVISIVLIIGHR